MVKIVLGLLSLLLFGAAAGVWYAVSTDQWPWDDRKQPATTVWALNDKLGRFLYENGQDTPEEIAAAQPRREALTAAEQGEVKKQLAADDRFKDRLVLHGGGGGAGGLKPLPMIRRRG